ncbi:MAG: type II toxin-antitoxin system VapB family antitoxin [Defluviitaleaceae bacterium]|nr:type II toxin-antitoxin system VapB family antitoxin [Defluviitaleaceae bacterium]
METAKVFFSGRSQAVRLPKEYRVSTNEIGIKKVGKAILLYPMDNEIDSFLESSPASDDFGDAIFEARNDDTQQARTPL